MNEPNQNLLEVQPQNETPIKQENYPSSQEVLQEQINPLASPWIENLHLNMDM